jgi:hypothetical protein
MQKFDYELKIDKNGILDPEQLHFFYYDIARDTIDSRQKCYCWNKKVEEFLETKKLDIHEVRLEDLQSEEVETLKDAIHFTVPKGKSKSIAFFNHLRNAFAHFRIRKWDSDSVAMEDINSKRQKTMVGRIKYEDLKQLWFIFFDQAEPKDEV